MPIEKSALIVVKDTDKQLNWIYPITLSENVIHNEEQLDEKLDSMDTQIAALAPDSSLSSSSTRAIQNRAVYAALQNKVDAEEGMGLSSNDYTDAEKSKLAGIANNANNYTHPSYTQRASGFYKITVDTSGHVSNVAAVSKTDITNLGIPSTDTTYAVASSSADGLMSSEDKIKLDNIEENANNYTHPSYTSRTSALYKVTVDATGHISAVSAVTKGDITALGIPAQDTTYTLSSFGVTATAAELNKLDGVTATSEELNYLDGVTSNIQTQLNGKLSTSGTAARATADATGQNIADTYIKSLSVNGRTITYTKGDGDTGTITTQDTNTTYSNATTSAAGLMSAADKTKLDGIAANATRVIVDAELSSTSTNAIQNQVVNEAIEAVNTRLDNIIDGAPEAYDTLVEIGTYISSHQSEYEALETLVGDKVSKEDGKGLSTNDYTTTEKNKLAGIASGAEVNQNAFSNVVVGSTTISADTKTDTLTFVAGSNITLTPDASGDKITIAATNTTYSNATTSAAGLMSAADKTKLDGIAANANNYTHPSYTSRASGLYKITVDGSGHVSAATAVAKSDITALGIPSTNTTYSNMTGADSDSAGTSGLVPAPAAGASNRYLRSDGTWAVPPDTNTTYTLSSFGITATAAELNKLDGVTATAAELNYVDGVTSNIQTQLNGKASSSHTHTIANVTGLQDELDTKVETLSDLGVSATATELNYVDGVTSNIQTQLNGKLSTSANAASASKLATARNINGMRFDGSANRFNYGTCSTAAATAAKTVSCTGFSLATGAEITVKFTVTNTASSPTLNVNSTGAKAIYYNGAAISAGYLKANKTYTFRYNGTQYDLVGDIDTNTTYSLSSFGVTASATELNYVDGVTSNIQTQLNGKAASSHTHTIANVTGLQDELDAKVESLTDLGVSATAAELNYMDGVTSNVQTQLNGKAASSHTHSGTQVTGLTASRALVSNSSGQVAVSAVTSTELGYLDGVTSAIQTQLNNKASSSHTHTQYAGNSKSAIEALLGFTINMAESEPSSVTEDTYFLEIEDIETVSV